jgi:hypothetical protein
MLWATDASTIPSGTATTRPAATTRVAPTWPAVKARSQRAEPSHASMGAATATRNATSVIVARQPPGSAQHALVTSAVSGSRARWSRLVLAACRAAMSRRDLAAWSQSALAPRTAA